MEEVISYLSNKYNISKEELNKNIKKGNIVFFNDIKKCFDFLYNFKSKSKELVLEEIYKIINLTINDNVNIKDNLKIGDYILKKHNNLDIYNGYYILIYNSFFYENNIPILE